jgi:hypothetical protein
MQIWEAVEKYLATVGEFGKPMALAQFGLPENDLVRMISAWDEDYGLNRHLELIPSTAENARDPKYLINGIPYAAILFRESIQDVFP